MNDDDDRLTMKIRRVYLSDDTLQTEVKDDRGEWQPTTPRSALGYDPPGLGDMLAHASASEQLVPGELVSIGALAAGSGMEISRWLAHGDTLELDLPGVGHITHQIK